MSIKEFSSFVNDHLGESGNDRLYGFYEDVFFADKYFKSNPENDFIIKINKSLEQKRIEKEPHLKFEQEIINGVISEKEKKAAKILCDFASLGTSSRSVRWDNSSDLEKDLNWVKKHWPDKEIFEEKLKMDMEYERYKKFIRGDWV